MQGSLFSCSVRDSRRRRGVDLHHRCLVLLAAIPDLARHGHSSALPSVDQSRRRYE